jgi:hypothetical protein
MAPVNDGTFTAASCSKLPLALCVYEMAGARELGLESPRPRHNDGRQVFEELALSIQSTGRGS